MVPLPSRRLEWTVRLYVGCFLVFLAAPLAAACLFAFNDSTFPSLPWRGFTLDWFFGRAEPKLGLLHDRRLVRSIGVSAATGAAVAVLATAIGLGNAFLFERCRFPLKRLLYVIMIVPLVIPGIVLGLSILVLANATATALQAATGVDPAFLRPGAPLVVLGQLSFLVTVSTLILGARLAKFDRAQEEAALNLGAGWARVMGTITLPFLKPAILSSLIVCFLVSFENFTTTLMLVGSDPPLTVAMYDRMSKAGSTPVLNAVSLLLVAGCAVLALASILVQREAKPRREASAAPVARDAAVPVPAPCHATVGSLS
ncbi:ABC transporter permease [Aureimonas leprariae]|uniref:ABC transporter permease subunit n=1 Tax=Plantimonas leprariae TaxID=2615207 RepID=A0A7V7TV04_9HYPH|nr:ABC transporter permease subunit [Aureimonas leprariae]KAB0677333.1 ABC transporter permease subunit [Aureimonas leprariae]